MSGKNAKSRIPAGVTGDMIETVPKLGVLGGEGAQIGAKLQRKEF